MGSGGVDYAWCTVSVARSRLLELRTRSVDLISFRAIFYVMCRVYFRSLIGQWAVHHIPWSLIRREAVLYGGGVRGESY